MISSKLLFMSGCFLGNSANVSRDASKRAVVTEELVFKKFLRLNFIFKQ
jgi:hypothetical protein